MQNIYVYDNVNGFGFLQGILLCIVIFFYPGGNRKSNMYLALHLFFVSLTLAAPFCQKLFYNIHERADRFLEPFLLLIYPFLYLYIKSFSEKIKPAASWPHLVPFLFYIPLVILSLVYQSELTLWNLSVFGFNISLLVFVLIKIILFGVYLYLCWKELDLLQNLVKDNFSDISRINLNWAGQLIIFGIGILVSYFVVMMLIVSNPELARLNFLLVTLLTAYIYFASFKGLTQPAIFKKYTGTVVTEGKREPGVLPEKVEIKAEQPERMKYERSALPEARQVELMNQLKDLMVKDRLFLEPELTIQTLGEKLNVSPYYISQVINQKLKNNFYDFINAYRVEEAKNLLLKPSHDNFTILAIAFESGFNSKTTLNTVFKKFTTQTPSEFKSKFNE